MSSGLQVALLATETPPLTHFTVAYSLSQLAYIAMHWSWCVYVHVSSLHLI